MLTLTQNERLQKITRRRTSILTGDASPPPPPSGSGPYFAPGQFPAMQFPRGYFP